MQNAISTVLLFAWIGGLVPAQAPYTLITLEHVGDAFSGPYFALSSPSYPLVPRHALKNH
jgi:hypothetical protein